MRLFATAIIALLVTAGLIYYNCAKQRRDEAKVKQNKPAESSLSRAEHQPDAKTEHAHSYDPSKDCLYRLYLSATIFGVFIALGGIYAIYTQTEATKKAAEATAQSAEATQETVRLQEVSLRQWTNIGHWEVWIDKREPTLRIRFHVVNPTKLVLDLESIDLSSRIFDLSQEPRIEEFHRSEALPPNNPRVLDVTLPLNEEQVRTLTQWDDDRGIIVIIKCFIVFVDAGGMRRWEQTVERGVLFDKGELFGLKDYIHLTPKVRVMRNHLREKKT
jgi:hypothetical protein